MFFLENYWTQLERTVSDTSLFTGSLLRRSSLKLCRPPISPCIINWIDRVVDSPGLSVIELMTGVGGQHPSMTWIAGAWVNWSTWSPTLVSRNEAKAVSPNFMSPKSIFTLSTCKPGFPVTVGIKVLVGLRKAKKSEPARITIPPNTSRRGNRLFFTCVCRRPCIDCLTFDIPFDPFRLRLMKVILINLETGHNRPFCLFTARGLAGDNPSSSNYHLNRIVEIKHWNLYKQPHPPESQRRTCSQLLFCTPCCSYVAFRPCL
jgi:hypothetical protein